MEPRKFSNSRILEQASAAGHAYRWVSMRLRLVKRMRTSATLGALAIVALLPMLVHGQTDETQIDPIESATFEHVLAAGDGVHLWFVRPRQPNDESRYRVAHHLPEMGAGTAIDALILPERPEALVAVNGSLYCIFSPAQVGTGRFARQVVRASVARDELGRWRYESTARSGRIVTPLPGFGDLLGLADDGRQPLVLMRLSDQVRDELAPALKSVESADEDLEIEELPAVEAESGTPELMADRQPDGERAEWWSLEDKVGQIVLLRLGTGAWESVPLPDGFPTSKGTKCRLLTGSWPMLVVDAGELEGASDSGEDDGHSWVYVLQKDNSWSTPFQVDLSPERIESSARVAGQTVVAVAGTGGSEVRLKCIRPGRVRDLSVIKGRTSARALVTLAGRSGGVGLVDRADGVDAIVLLRVDLDTGTLIDETLMNAPNRLGREEFSPLILVGALLLTIVIVFLVRPDPTAIRIVLPDQTALAEPRRRLVAVLLDLIPAAILAVWLLDETLAEMRHWPLFSKDIIDSAPALLAILITVVHSTASEVVWGRTLGKALTGCRVLDVLGGRAAFRQILLRNLLKIVVLIVPPLALFVFMNPFRQRLGDLIAKTMVVVPRPDDGAESDESSDQQSTE